MECNPLHNGHLHLLKKAKELGSDFIVVVMSGDYMQRGEPAILPKHTRASWLLKSGADLVLEMPTVFATGSAEYFARCGVSILNNLGCVDTLLFGSEDGDLNALQEKASQEEIPVDSPNNILGINYLKALSYFHSSIEPVTIKRLGEEYHSADAFTEVPSASAIRKVCKQSPSRISELSGIPAYVKEDLVKEQDHLLYLSHFDNLMGLNLIGATYENLADTFDIFPDLAEKILKNKNHFCDAEQFLMNLKSKDITYSHLSRALLHLVLGYKKEDATYGVSKEYAPYSRILGMNKKAHKLLSTVKKKASIPLVNKPAKAKKELEPESLSLLEKDFAASHIYCLLAYGKIIPEETKTPILFSR